MSQVVPIGERFNRNVPSPGQPGKPVVDAVGPLLLQRGDRILLCSGRPVGNVTDADVAETVAGASHFRRRARTGRDGAAQRGGARCDNVTVLAVEWESAETATARSGFDATSATRSFASTIQASVAGQDAVDEPTRPRSSARSGEINEAIRRTSQRKS